MLDLAMVTIQARRLTAAQFAPTPIRPRPPRRPRVRAAAALHRLAARLDPQPAAA